MSTSHNNSWTMFKNRVNWRIVAAMSSIISALYFLFCVWNPELNAQSFWEYIYPGIIMLVFFIGIPLATILYEVTRFPKDPEILNNTTDSGTIKSCVCNGDVIQIMWLGRLYVVTITEIEVIFNHPSHTPIDLVIKVSFRYDDSRSGVTVTSDKFQYVKHLSYANRP